MPSGTVPTCGGSPGGVARLRHVRLGADGGSPQGGGRLRHRLNQSARRKTRPPWRLRYTNACNDSYDSHTDRLTTSRGSSSSIDTGAWAARRRQTKPLPGSASRLIPSTAVTNSASCGESRSACRRATFTSTSRYRSPVTAPACSRRPAFTPASGERQRGNFGVHARDWRPAAPQLLPRCYQPLTAPTKPLVNKLFVLVPRCRTGRGIGASKFAIRAGSCPPSENRQRSVVAR